MSAVTGRTPVEIPFQRIRDRVEALAWDRISDGLDTRGCGVIPGLLSADECREIADLYADERHFRSRVVMARHGYGRGEYKYFDYPLPPVIHELRTAIYGFLAPVANRWHAALGLDAAFPPAHSEFVERCHAAGQCRPTPLLLRYDAGDFNCLHQDLYGPNVFPLQIAVLLSDPGRDFTGGEFVLTEQRPRMQSRVEVVQIGRGDAVVFPVNKRPVTGSRGSYRVTMRHGVSRVLAGRRFTLGIIFHDAL